MLCAASPMNEYSEKSIAFRQAGLKSESLNGRLKVQTPRITVVGIGPGPVSCLTKEAEAELIRADKIFFRLGSHPVYDWLRALGKQLIRLTCCTRPIGRSPKTFTSSWCLRY
jgi:hypothetical protein